MTIQFELASDFLDREGIALSIADLKYGYDRGWLHPWTLVEQAVCRMNQGDDDPVLIRVALLLRDDVDELSELLAELDSPGCKRDSIVSARKWLYLQLKAAFESRDRLADPLGVVEYIYCDFGHPPEIANLVGYMPLQPGEEAGEDAIMRRWAAFLRSEHDALRTKAPGS